MSKTPKPTEYKFKIDAYTPDTMPMERLAEYMATLAKLLGEPTSVHFRRLEKGSTVLVQQIDNEAVPKVQARINRIKKGDAPIEEINSFSAINEMLREDNAIGTLIRGQKGKLLIFPGREAEAPLEYGGFNQEGTIDGIPIRVGGRNEIVHVTIQEEDREFSCEAHRGIAKSIADHLFTSPLRLIGRGRWHRDKNGEWILDNFRISGFVPLKDAPLSEVVKELRAVEGKGWTKLKDPLGELYKLRHGNNGENDGRH